MQNVIYNRAWLNIHISEYTDLRDRLQQRKHTMFGCVLPRKQNPETQECELQPHLQTISYCMKEGKEGLEHFLRSSPPSICQLRIMLHKINN